MRALLLLMLLGLVVIPAQAQQTEQTPLFTPTDCPIENPTNFQMDCGTVQVPEDYANPDGIQLSLPLAIFRSPNPQAEPVVLLMGGPGASAFLDIPIAIPDRYQRILANRDFIIFDQRGTGFVEPALACPGTMRGRFQGGGTAEERAQRDNELLVACQDVIEQSGLRVANYQSAYNARDVELLRQALGYDTWNLLGVSYGSKLALVVMRDYPAGVRSVILDSVYPLQVDLYASRADNRPEAFTTLFEACVENSACNTAYPDLETQFYDLLRELNESPHAIGGRLRISGDWVAGNLFSSLYDTQRLPILPSTVARLADGDFEAARNLFPEQVDSVNEIMNISVQCNEEVAFSSLDSVLALTDRMPEPLQADFVFDTRKFYDLCSRWNTYVPNPAENRPISSDIPALVLSGEFDPITPPEWGALAAKDLSNSYFYTLNSVGHGVARSDDCAMGLVLDFLDDPMTAPDSTCVDLQPDVPFVVE